MTSVPFGTMLKVKRGISWVMGMAMWSNFSGQMDLLKSSVPLPVESPLTVNGSGGEPLKSDESASQTCNRGFHGRL